MNLQEAVTKRILSNIYPEKIGEILKGIKVSYSSDTILKIYSLGCYLGRYSYVDKW